MPIELDEEVALLDVRAGLDEVHDDQRARIRTRKPRHDDGMAANGLDRAMEAQLEAVSIAGQSGRRAQHQARRYNARQTREGPHHWNHRRRRLENGWPSGGKKRADACEVVHDGRRRQRRDEATPVRFRAKPRIQYGQDAAVAAVADQAAEALLQREDRQRDLILAERIAAARAYRVDARGRNRIA